jgi:hypothetical protein
MMDREWIEKEIAALEMQKDQHQNLYVQAVGAIMAYRVMLAKMSEQNGVAGEIGEVQEGLTEALSED